MRIAIIGCLSLVISFNANSQLKQRKLGPALNNPAFNYYAPFVSLDANTILFLYDYTDDNLPGLFISLRQGVDWKEPVPVPKKFTAGTFMKAVTLSLDGKTMYMTMKRGAGGFDIWASQVTGTAFSEPVSIGAPINSITNESSPTFSPDGNTIFFMRCNKMTFDNADECKIMMAKKRNGLWETPVELPPSINAGNSQMPRMLADGQSFIFSSNRHTPTKGGMDLYLSKWMDNQWSSPVNLDFANTAADDIYSSASSIGISLYKDVKGDRKNELVEYFFPPEIKPKAVMRVIGLVEGSSDMAKTNISIVNLENKKVHYSFLPDAKGNFIGYIPEGNVYGLIVDPPTENLQYFMKRYDLSPGNKVPNFERLTATIKPIKAGDGIELKDVSFQPASAEINPTSIIQLQKTARMMRGNPNMNFTVDVSLFGFIKDSIIREDLTEVKTDTTVYEKEFQVDSVTTEMRDSVAIEYTYHNDRTQKQANAIADFFIKQGIKAERISTTYKAVEEPVAEKRKTVIYLKAR
jgi:hypothetical protein